MNNLYGVGLGGIDVWFCVNIELVGLYFNNILFIFIGIVLDDVALVKSIIGVYGEFGSWIVYLNFFIIIGFYCDGGYCLVRI